MHKAATAAGKMYQLSAGVCWNMLRRRPRVASRFLEYTVWSATEDTYAGTDIPPLHYNEREEINALCLCELVGRHSGAATKLQSQTREWHAFPLEEPERPAQYIKTTAQCSKNLSTYIDMAQVIPARPGNHMPVAAISSSRAGPCARHGVCVK